MTLLNFGPGDDPGPDFAALVRRASLAPVVPDAPVDARFQVTHGTTCVAIRYADGVVKHRLDELDDGRVGRAFLDRERIEVDARLLELLIELFGERDDLVGAAIYEVDCAQQRRFFRERETHGLAEDSR